MVEVATLICDPDGTNQDNDHDNEVSAIAITMTMARMMPMPMPMPLLMPPLLLMIKRIVAIPEEKGSEWN